MFYNFLFNQQQRLLFVLVNTYVTNNFGMKVYVASYKILKTSLYPKDVSGYLNILQNIFYHFYK